MVTMYSGRFSKKTGHDLKFVLLHCSQPAENSAKKRKTGPEFFVAAILTQKRPKTGRKRLFAEKHVFSFTILTLTRNFLFIFL
jgi:hypothetical protein